MTRTDWIVYKVSVLCVVCSQFCDMTYELLHVGSRRSQEEEEKLTSQVARLEREKTEAANARADAAEARASAETVRADAAEARADAAESKAKKEVAEKMEEKWTILALRCDKAQHAEGVDVREL